jgi:hypothetical protein
LTGAMVPRESVAPRYRAGSSVAPARAMARTYGADPDRGRAPWTSRGVARQAAMVAGSDTTSVGVTHEPRRASRRNNPRHRGQFTPAKARAWTARRTRNRTGPRAALPGGGGRVHRDVGRHMPRHRQAPSPRLGHARQGRRHGGSCQPPERFRVQGPHITSRGLTVAGAPAPAAFT